ncbi:MAG: hypothetical protein ICV68_17730, partial [Pyrinomonadaceae bacterium]|nr:hypothetical protein [Pyrinomonadaceae bacterium]
MPHHVGLDLGQSNDYSALAVIHDTFRENVRGERKKALDLVHLERFALRTSYVDIVNHVVGLLKDPVLHPWETDGGPRRTQTHPTLIVDRTGVGSPVTDLFTKKRVRFVSVTITGGHSTNRGEGRQHYHVPKRDLVSALEVPFHSEELKVAEGLE